MSLIAARVAVRTAVAAVTQIGALTIAAMTQIAVRTMTPGIAAMIQIEQRTSPTRTVMTIMTQIAVTTCVVVEDQIAEMTQITVTTRITTAHDVVALSGAQGAPVRRARRVLRRGSSCRSSASGAGLRRRDF